MDSTTGKEHVRANAKWHLRKVRFLKRAGKICGVMDRVAAESGLSGKYSVCKLVKEEILSGRNVRLL
jgi:hypothetical protein